MVEGHVADMEATDLLRNIRPQQLSDSYVPVYMAGLVLYAGRGAIFALVYFGYS